jgi:hypothetical protein
MPRPSAIGRSSASAPVCSTFARVVSKCVLFGTTFPGPPRTEKRMRSAARPLVRRDDVLEREKRLYRLPQDGDPV